MKIKICLLILLLFSVSLYAQQDKENRKVELADGTFVVPENYPIVLKSVKPVYPREAILQDIQGKVFVKVTINESGKVEGVKIAKGISPSLNKSALAAAKKMEFSPALYKGQKVKVSIAVPVNFILDPEKKGPKLDTGIPVAGERKADNRIKDNQDVKDGEPDPSSFMQVDKNPEPIKLVKPHYPEIAQRAGITGIVILRVLVNKEGKPIKTKLIKADNEMFVEPSKDAAMKTMFTPAIQDGKPITCWVNIPFRFSISKESDSEKLETFDEMNPSSSIKVEKKPEPIELAKPHYPEIAQRAGKTGIVILGVLVDKDGKPLKTRVIKADDDIFVEPSKDAAMKTMFTPAIQDGKPITCWVNIPFRFSISKESVSGKPEITGEIWAGTYKYYPKEISDKLIEGVVKFNVRFTAKKETVSMSLLEGTNTILDQKATEYVKEKIESDGYLSGYMDALSEGGIHEFIYKISYKIKK